MSAPRFIAPRTTYLLTRRCFGRQFLLRPSPKINQIFEFCLAAAAARADCQIHAYCVLSNHYHLVVTDLHGNLPVFMHWLNEYVAKCVNAVLGRWESFWAPGSYSSVALTDEDDVIAKLVYVFTNPVAAGLVRTHADWPGAHSRPEQIGGPSKPVSRPEGFFREKGPVPESLSLELVPPPGFTCNAWVSDLQARIEARESEIRAVLGANGRRFLGRQRVLEQSPWGRPTGAEPRRGLAPRVAARDKWKRVAVLQRLKAFLNTYREALRQFVGGHRTVTFPFGTYAMRVRFGVTCEES